MKWYKADLHIHSVLSPCGSLDMSPMNIVQSALDKELEIIAITDHNSTLQAKYVRKVAQKHELLVVTGIEVTTKEEIHVLAYFQNDEDAQSFQKYVDERLPNIENNPDFFGYQVVVNENDEIVYEEPKLLISGIDSNFEQVVEAINNHNGVSIPAHINKPKNSILSQLGFIPPGSAFSAIEVSRRVKDNSWQQWSGNKDYFVVANSDAHYLENIGDETTSLYMKENSIDAFFEVIRNINENNLKTSLTAN